jgi:hypothetical protein
VISVGLNLVRGILCVSPGPFDIALAFPDAADVIFAQKAGGRAEVNPNFITVCHIDYLSPVVSYGKRRKSNQSSSAVVGRVCLRQ